MNTNTTNTNTTNINTSGKNIYLCSINDARDFKNNKNKIIFETLDEAIEYASNKCSVGVNVQNDTVTTLVTVDIYELKFGQLIDYMKTSYSVYKDRYDFSIKVNKKKF